MSAIEDLVAELAKLPGIGRKTAQRLTFHLLKQPEDSALRLADAIRGVRARVVTCATCGNLGDEDPCPICRDPRRDAQILCVVEEAGDVSAIERAGRYRGRYHVLGGTLSALDGRGPDQLNLGSLVERVKGGAVREVVLGLNATVEGQTTAHYVMDLIQPSGVSVTRLAHGVPVGGELDYLDEGTLAAAFAARRAM